MSNAVNARAAIQQEQSAAPIAAAAAAASEDLLSKLERLAALHASGALTDAEFAAVKASLIVQHFGQPGSVRERAKHPLDFCSKHLAGTHIQGRGCLVRA